MGAVEHHPATIRAVAPVCSVCISNYNGIGLLASCIDSVLAQDAGVEYEIIVHDDASTDASVTFLRENYPQVELLVSAVNVGFCIANNRMVERARGDFILLLNNDAALYPDALRSLLGAQTLPGIFSLPQYDWRTGELVDRGCRLDPFYNPVPNVDQQRREVAYVIGACLWLPRTLWKELGGLPEWMESLGEDMYLGCLARLYGHSVSVLPTSGYRHRQGASFGGNRAEGGRLTTTLRRRCLSERNKTMVLVICTPTPLMWLLLAVHVVLLACEGGLLTALRRDMHIWRDIYGAALRCVWNCRDLALAERERVQTNRVSSAVRYFSGFTLFPRKIAMLLRYGLPRFVR